MRHIVLGLVFAFIMIGAAKAEDIENTDEKTMDNKAESAAEDTAASKAIKNNIMTVNAWAKASVGNMQVSAAYLMIGNIGREDVTLTSVETPVADQAEIHTMMIEGDIARMRALPTLDIPAGEEIVMEPGGVHIMLMGLHNQLKNGDTFPLTLVFNKTVKINVDVSVK